MFDKNKFAQILKNINDTYNSQRDFSKKSEINRTYLSQYMNARLEEPPKPKILEKLANASNGITNYAELMFICGYTNNYTVSNEYQLKATVFENYISELKLMNLSPITIDKIRHLFLELPFEGTILHLGDILSEFSCEKQNQIRYTYELMNNAVLNEFIGTLTKKTLKDISNAFPITDTPISVPVIGKISAGMPILAVENIEGREFAPSSYIKEGFDYFYLRVQGDSMNLKFNEGDIVLVQKQDTLENDEIGVILVNGFDATVKKYKTENGLIILSPMSTNPENTVQIYNPKDIEIKIIGKIVSYQGKIN